MKIGDKAEASDSDEVRLARDSVGVYRLESDELTPADEIGNDEFPEYGDFIEATTTAGGAEPEWDTPVFVECPGSLASVIVELDLAIGDVFRIEGVRKNASNEWVYTVTEETDPTA